MIKIKRGACILFFVLKIDGVEIENSFDTYLGSCLKIWTKLDLLRAIKPCEEDRADYIEKTTEAFLLLYQPLISGLTTNKASIGEDNIDCLRETCSSINSYLEDIYSKKAHDSFICTRVVIAKITEHLTEFLKTKP